jgi:hypothetical protein
MLIILFVALNPIHFPKYWEKKKEDAAVKHTLLVFPKPREKGGIIES